LNISTLSNIFHSHYLSSEYYRPVINLSFLIENKLFQNDLFYSHLFNLIIHIFNCIILYFVLKKFKIDEIYSKIFILFFSVHPLLNNSISWVAGRNDTLLSIFVLMSYLSFLNYIDKGKIHFLILFIISTLTSFLTKETALVFPIIY